MQTPPCPGWLPLLLGFRAAVTFCVMIAAIRAETPAMLHEEIRVEAPFAMPVIRVPIFPARDFPITDFGAQIGGEMKNTDAIRGAITACHEAGGGRVVVPAGDWLTGAVHLKSNVNFHLAAGAVLCPFDQADDVLRRIVVRNIQATEKLTPFKILGDKDQPVRDVLIDNVVIETARGLRNRYENAENVRETGIVIRNFIEGPDKENKNK